MSLIGFRSTFSISKRPLWNLWHATLRTGLFEAASRLVELWKYANITKACEQQLKRDLNFPCPLTRDTQHRTGLCEATNSETCDTLHRTGLFEATSRPLELWKRTSLYRCDFSESFACLFDPQRIFGNPLRTFRQSFASRSLQNRDFSCFGEIFVSITLGPLGCLLGFWPSGPKPCRGQLYHSMPSSSV